MIHTRKSIGIMTGCAPNLQSSLERTDGLMTLTLHLINTLLSIYLVSLNDFQ